MCSLANFEVIEIIDDSTLYLALLKIDWAFKNQAIINLKKEEHVIRRQWNLGYWPARPCIGTEIHIINHS